MLPTEPTSNDVKTLAVVREETSDIFLFPQTKMLMERVNDYFHLDNSFPKRNPPSAT